MGLRDVKMRDLEGTLKASPGYWWEQGCKEMGEYRVVKCSLGDRWEPRDLGK